MSDKPLSVDETMKLVFGYADAISQSDAAPLGSLTEKAHGAAAAKLQDRIRAELEKLTGELAKSRCLQDETWEHHDQTDDFPCSQCRSDAS
jgi:hypothetical protein